eukprot:PITA_04526
MINKYKARVVAKVFSQVHGIDYDETFAMAEKMDSIKMAPAIATTKKWDIHHIDVKNAFLHGDINEEIYMDQPKGYVHDSSLVCTLRQSSYGLKQAPHAWYAKMDSYLLSQDFQRFKSDPNVYMLRKSDSLLLIVLYVYDLLITSNSRSTIVAIKYALHDKFFVTDMELLNYILGLEISQSNSRITLAQSKCAWNVIFIFKMTYCKPTATPFLSEMKLENGSTTPLVDCTLYMQLVGSLLYLTHSQLDISYVIGVLSKYKQESHELHWKAAKRILRYIKGTIDNGIHCVARCSLDITGYTFKLGRDPSQRQHTKHIEVHMHLFRGLICDVIIDLQYCSPAEQIANIFTKPFTKQRFATLQALLGGKAIITAQQFS